MSRRFVVSIHSRLCSSSSPRRSKTHVHAGPGNGVMYMVLQYHGNSLMHDMAGYMWIARPQMHLPLPS